MAFPDRHFIVGLAGPHLTDGDKAVLKHLKPAGVILRAHNFLEGTPYPEWLKALKALQEEVKGATKLDNPIFAIDHEGGRVHRPPPPITHFPAARDYASKAQQVARAMAIELCSLGINLSFAPVADIHSNPQNPVIGERAFGSSASEVLKNSLAFAQSLLSHGIIPVAKHFPGHGETAQDSHEELPVLNLDVEALERRELIPFAALVKGGIPAILTAHILFPRLDAHLPATLSARILDALLRKRLAFTGVVISDDLDMKAIAERFSDDLVAESAFNAGCDILLFNHDAERAVRIYDKVKILIEKRKISINTSQTSEKRVTHLMNRLLKAHDATPLDHKVLEKHALLCQSVTDARTKT